MKINTSNLNIPEAKKFYDAFMLNGLPIQKRSENWKFTDLEKNS